MLVNFLKLIFWRYLRVTIVKLPLPITNTLVSLLSHFQIFFLRKRRNITFHEIVISHLEDNKSLNKMVYRSFNNHLKSWVKMCFLSKINTSNVHHYLPINGLKYLDESLMRGKGVILLNPHFGPFLFVLPSLGYRGYKLNQVTLQGKPIIGKRKGLQKFIYENQFNAVEKNMPVKFINAAMSNVAATKNILKMLTRNEIVLFASTGRGGKLWEEVNFLGRRATFNLIPFKIALKTGATLLPVFVMNSEPIAKVIIEKPLEVRETDTPGNILQMYVAVLSSYVKKYPEHFAFFLYDMRIKADWDRHPFFSDYNEK